jgi:coenzyme F420-reducing hydrogenase delta subunit
MGNDRLTKAKERLNMYYEAEIAVLTGQEYRIGTRSMKRADLAEIRSAITELEKQVKELGSGGKRKAYRITPRDL